MDAVPATVDMAQELELAFTGVLAVHSKSYLDLDHMKNKIVAILVARLFNHLSLGGCHDILQLK